MPLLRRRHYKLTGFQASQSHTLSSPLATAQHSSPAPSLPKTTKLGVLCQLCLPAYPYLNYLRRSIAPCNQSEGEGAFVVSYCTALAIARATESSVFFRPLSLAVRRDKKNPLYRREVEENRGGGEEVQERRGEKRKGEERCRSHHHRHCHHQPHRWIRTFSVNTRAPKCLHIDTIMPAAAERGPVAKLRYISFPRAS